MNPGKYDRNVTLSCPTCGGEEFEKDESDIAKCVACGRELTREELVQSNAENIQAALNDVKEEAAKDLRKSLTRAFRRLR